MNRHTIYIPSRGRSATCLTGQIVKQEGLKFKIVVEPQEREAYLQHFSESEILVMQESNKGITYVRNFIKNYSTAANESYHWQVDDNIRSFRVRKNNKNEKATATECLTKVEKFVDEYTNIGGAGICHQIYAFTHKVDMRMNFNIYSCFLLNNSVPLSYRDGLIEDVDYSLQVLTLGAENYVKKQGTPWCTVFFTRLIMEKLATMALKGGNTEISHANGGRERRKFATVKQWPGVFIWQYRNNRLTFTSRVWSKFRQPLIRKQTHEN